MANQHASLSALFTAIANAIRAKTGGTAQIVADTFPAAIAGISTGVDTSDATAGTGDVLSGKTFYAGGVKKTGSIATYAGSTSVTPGTSAQTLQTAGKYLDANIIVAAAQASGKQVATGSVTPTRNDLYRYPVEVTGLGFTPSTVVFYVNSASDISTESKNYVVASISGAWTVLKKGALIGFVYRNTSTSVVNLTMTNGGFYLTATESGYYVETAKYNYIAIGA